MDVEAVMDGELRGLRRRRPEVTGAVLAGRDGLLISSDLPSTEAVHLAALSAVGFGLGHQVAHAVCRSGFRESVVRTATATVVTYPAGRHALLTLVTGAATDLEGLHEEARAVADRAGSVVDTHRCGTGATPVRQADGALATRTPMTTLPRRVTRSTGRRRPPV
ncbi:roadblock/LC7 domain-containing protein [Micromonospora sp. CPCC 205711]|uniref:roadblock/LC7 domain-containing protein n=1 Tax=Micromonospora sp. CPCC 205547 TaxID=3122400 RepID=UPI002FEF3F3F